MKAIVLPRPPEGTVRTWKVAEMRRIIAVYDDSNPRMVDVAVKRVPDAFYPPKPEAA